MSEQLTTAELQIAIDAIEFALAKGTANRAHQEHGQQALRKLKAGLVHAQRHDAQRGTVEPEHFPRQITVEEAQQYSAIGEEMMVAATARRIDERTHYKLSCLMIGFTSALTRVTKVPREVFCNNVVTNVMFAALKAAYVIPSASQEPADGRKSQD